MYIRYKIHLEVISWKIAIFRFRLAPKKDLHFSSLSPKISVINSMPLFILFKCFLLLFEPKVLIFWLFSFLLGHGTAHTSHVALRGVLHNILYTVKPFEILRSRKTILFIFLRPTIRHCSSVFLSKALIVLIMNLELFAALERVLDTFFVLSNDWFVFDYTVPWWC